MMVTGASIEPGEGGAQAADYAGQVRHFEKLLSSITDFAYTFDLRGRFTFVNKALLDLWGLTLLDARGKDFFDLGYPPDLAAKLQAQIQQVIDTRLQVVDETPYTNPAGLTGYYQYIFTPMLSADGRVEAVAGTTRDISRGKEIEREREALARLVDGERRTLASIIAEAPAFICVLRGPQHVFELANERYFTLIGRRDVLGKSVIDALPEVRGQGFIELLDRVYATGETYTGREVRLFLHHAGEPQGMPLKELFINFVYQAIRDADGRVNGIFVHGVDVTDMVQARDSVRESEARFRQMANSAPVHIWMNDDQGRGIFANERYLEFTGTTLDDLLRDSWPDIVHPEDKAAHLARFQADFDARRDHQNRVRLRRKDGAYRTFEITSRPRYEGERFVGYVGISQDVTERLRAESATELLADAGAAFSSSRDFEATLDALARLVVPGFADWCAVDLCAPDGELRRALVVHKDPQKVQWAHELRRRYPPRKEEASGPAKVIATGATMWAAEIPEDAIRTGAQDAAHADILLGLQLRSYMCVPLEARGRRLGALTLVTSESGRVYTEADVAVAEELGRRAGLAADSAELLRAEQAARAEAEEANRAKDKFLAVLSHELRTPLSPVVMTIPAMRHDPALPEKFREDLAMVRRNIDLEVKLIDDLLDLSRVTSGKLRLRMQHVHAHELLQHVVRSSAGDLTGKRLDLRLSLDAANDRLLADPARLQQVFWNLLRNSIKFTEEAGAIEIRTSNPADGRLIVEVRDSGVGIAPDVLPRIFDAFEQGDARVTRQFGGLGLGLAIAKAVVEMHGGRIHAASGGGGHGATFTVELATAGAAVEDAAALGLQPPESPPLRRPARVLLAEDHPDTAHTMARVLEAAGYEVRWAGSVAAAVELAGRESFDVLVSDIGLPDGSGYELMQQLARRHGMKGVALSGYGMDEDVRRSREAGFSEHMVKPIDIAQLQAMLRRVVGAGPVYPANAGA